MTKVSSKPFFTHILLIISPSQVISADNKSRQGRRPSDSNLSPAALAAVEEIMQQLTATRESLQSRWELVLVLHCDVGWVSLHSLLAASSSLLVEWWMLLRWGQRDDPKPRNRPPRTPTPAECHPWEVTLMLSPPRDHLVGAGQVQRDGSPLSF